MQSLSPMPVKISFLKQGRNTHVQFSSSLLTSLSCSVFFLSYPNPFTAHRQLPRLVAAFQKKKKSNCSPTKLLRSGSSSPSDQGGFVGRTSGHLEGKSPPLSHRPTVVSTSSHDVTEGRMAETGLQDEKGGHSRWPLTTAELGYSQAP